MGVFRKDSEPKAEPEVEPTPAAETPQPKGTQHKGPRKKDAPTPKRREAEAARLKRVNPTLGMNKKEAKKLETQRNREARMKAMEARDGTPEKVLMRDLVDSRWNIGEFLLPAMVLILALTFLQEQVPGMAMISLVLMYAYILVVLVDLAWLWRQYRKLAAERLPNVSLKGKGVMMYGFNRAIQMRRLRLPQPRVNRGEKF